MKDKISSVLNACSNKSLCRYKAHQCCRLFANLGKYVYNLFPYRPLWHVTDLLQSFSGGKWILVSKAHETITVWLFLGYFNGMLSTAGFMSLINVHSSRTGKRPHLHWNSIFNCPILYWCLVNCIYKEPFLRRIKFDK